VEKATEMRKERSLEDTEKEKGKQAKKQTKGCNLPLIWLCTKPQGDAGKSMWADCHYYRTAENRKSLPLRSVYWENIRQTNAAKLTKWREM